MSFWGARRFRSSVRIRVSEGGHDVPIDKIIDRRFRSFAELAWFMPHLDQCHLYDNSTGAPTLVAEKTSKGFFCWDELPSDLHAALVVGGVRVSDDLNDLD